MELNLTMSSIFECCQCKQYCILVMNENHAPYPGNLCENCLWQRRLSTSYRVRVDQFYN
jgi:hypothetical protein